MNDLQSSDDQHAIGESDAHFKYDTPADVTTDETLDQNSKRVLLESWKTDLDNRLLAESEGMSSSEPIGPNKEAQLADQLALVNQALELLDEQ